MARVRIHEEAKLDWAVPGDQVSPQSASKFTEGELTAKVRIREAGAADRPQLVEILYAPDAEIQLHSHAEDEIIFVRAGLMRAGSRTLHPGDSIFIAGGTFYSFRAGPDGLQMLNFRPREDVTFITAESKEDLLAAVKAGG
jgi:quercetin dioxygenase-like cupin family protein